MKSTHRLHIERFVSTDPFQENCYVVSIAGPSGEGNAGGEGSEGSRPCWIIDPGNGADAVADAIRKGNLAPAGILLTHGHFDHIAGIPAIRQAWPDVPICIGRLEADALESPQMNLSASFGIPARLADRPTRLLDDGEELALGGTMFRAILAAGHSPGGMCYHCPASGDLFSGDVLFADSVGRTDLPGSDGRLMFANIHGKLLVLPAETRVWPGHGPATTIGREKADNPFLA
jgi:glyoxylase-like metal-dependent hydrolase (beta-lactamase superfamily II)